MKPDYHSRRARNVALAKSALDLLFLSIVAVTQPNPIGLAVSGLDLAFVPLFIVLARRMPRAAIIVGDMLKERDG